MSGIGKSDLVKQIATTPAGKTPRRSR